jgi:hypothetical protein
MKGKDARRPSMRETNETAKEGYLEKMGSNKKWQKRFFEISGHYMRYFPDSKKDLGKMKGVIDLDGLTEVKRTALPKDQFEIKLTLVEKGATEEEEDVTTLYLVKASGETSANEWVEVLEGA